MPQYLPRRTNDSAARLFNLLEGTCLEDQREGDKRLVLGVVPQHEFTYLLCRTDRFSLLPLRPHRVDPGLVVLSKLHVDPSAVRYSRTHFAPQTGRSHVGPMGLDVLQAGFFRCRLALHLPARGHTDL